MRVGGARPPPFTISTITYKVAVYAPAERADTLPLFLLYSYMYSVVQTKRPAGEPVWIAANILFLTAFACRPSSCLYSILCNTASSALINNKDPINYLLFLGACDTFDVFAEQSEEGKYVGE